MRTIILWLHCIFEDSFTQGEKYLHDWLICACPWAMQVDHFSLMNWVRQSAWNPQTPKHRLSWDQIGYHLLLLEQHLSLNQSILLLAVLVFYLICPLHRWGHWTVQRVEDLNAYWTIESADPQRHRIFAAEVLLDCKNTGRKLQEIHRLSGLYLMLSSHSCKTGQSLINFSPIWTASSARPLLKTASSFGDRMGTQESTPHIYASLHAPNG